MRALSEMVLFLTHTTSICSELIFRPIDPGLAFFAFADVFLQNLDTKPGFWPDTSN